MVLSTDKAVYPVNAMGMTKALMEKIMIAKSLKFTNSETVFCGTRYGNVLASRGSVIPLFISQIKSGMPITITDPNMTRFMMSLDEAIDLVLYAFKNGNNGDLYVHKAPACTIGILVKALLKIYKADNEIKVIGTRHGEKLHETLISGEDREKAVEIGKYIRIPPDSRNLNYDLYFTDGESKSLQQKGYSSNNVKKLNLSQTIKLLKKLEIVKKSLK